MIRFLSLCLALLTLISAAVAQHAAPVALYDRLVEHVEAEEEDLVAFRHDLHRHPELSGEEVRTARRVAERLTALGFEVRTGVGGHGVVGVLEGAQPGPTVAFRADMDAVRSMAEDPVDYRSVVPGVRHICGHDVHTTIGVALAEGFAAVRDDLAGTVMLVFQPEEETGTGAKAMLRDGVFADLTPDAIFAVHTTPYNVGDVATAEGGMMAGRAFVEVTIRSDDGLEAAGLDAAGLDAAGLDAAVHAVREALSRVGTLTPEQAFQTAPPGFVLVQFFGRTDLTEDGRAATVRAQVMTAGYDDRARAKTDMLAALADLDLPGFALDTNYDEGFMEGVNNDSALVALSNAGINAYAPEVTIRTVTGAVPAFSEDFGSLQTVTPGVMYFLGVSNPETGTVGMPHSPDYIADDAAIVIGTRAIAAAMLQRLEAP
ncbi:MAG: M20 family metallopeptidase [Bacteroidota bacterium]